MKVPRSLLLIAEVNAQPIIVTMWEKYFLLSCFSQSIIVSPLSVVIFVEINRKNYFRFLSRIYMYVCVCVGVYVGVC